MFQNNNIAKERGASLYLAFMIMTALVGIALGTSTLLLSELHILKGIGHSVFAFYATDAGIERALYIDNGTCSGIEDPGDRQQCLKDEFDSIGASPPGSISLSNGSAYQLIAEEGGQGNCPVGKSHCVKSTGIFQEARRAVRVTR